MCLPNVGTYGKMGDNNNKERESEMMKLDKMIDNAMITLRRTSQDKWTDARFAEVKSSTMTAKGDFGEDLTTHMLNELGFEARRVNQGIGEFDIVMGEWLIEHKLATEDTNGSFQFNGIKKDVNYDIVFCLGVSPNDLWFTIITKDEALDLSVSMTKGGSDSFKYSVPVNKMIAYNEKNVMSELTRLGVVA